MQTGMQVAQPYVPARPVAHLHDHLQGSDLRPVRSNYQACILALSGSASSMDFEAGPRSLAEIARVVTVCVENITIIQGVY
jgi:hypothetical protein